MILLLNLQLYHIIRKIFNEETMPVIDYFREKGVLLEINAETAPKEVFENVLRALNRI